MQSHVNTQVSIYRYRDSHRSPDRSTSLQASMEEKPSESSSSGSTPSSSRWNPTKEQVSMLESLYKQGVRTPNADQIQHITKRLKVYGHIEGKNVFYWFQNHKARERQKQKQERLIYINPFAHGGAPPMLATPCTSNVICSPFCTPQSSVTFYPHCPKLPLPARRKKLKEDDCKPDNVQEAIGQGYMPVKNSCNGDGSNNKNTQVRKTLPLFPLNPTGVVEKESIDGFQDSIFSRTQNFHDPMDSETLLTHGDQPFFDFLPRKNCSLTVIKTRIC